MLVCFVLFLRLWTNRWQRFAVLMILNRNKFTSWNKRWPALWILYEVCSYICLFFVYLIVCLLVFLNFYCCFLIFLTFYFILSSFLNHTIELNGWTYGSILTPFYDFIRFLSWLLVFGINDLFAKWIVISNCHPEITWLQTNKHVLWKGEIMQQTM